MKNKLKKNIPQIKKIAQKLLTLLKIKGKIEIEETEEGILNLNISSPDSALLIGLDGQTLDSFSHLIKVILFQKTGQKFSLFVDVGGYRQRQTQVMIEKVEKIARRVARTGYAEVLEPMNSFQRRLAHLAVSKIKGVTTGSVGQEPERRIIIRPE